MQDKHSCCQVFVGGLQPKNADGHYHYLLVGLCEPDSRLISEEGH